MPVLNIERLIQSLRPTYTKSAPKPQNVIQETGLFPQVGQAINPFIEDIINIPGAIPRALFQTSPVDPETGMPNIDFAKSLWAPKAKEYAENILGSMQIERKLLGANPIDLGLSFIEHKWPKLFGYEAGEKGGLKKWGTTLRSEQGVGPSSTLGRFFPYENKAVVYDLQNRVPISSYSRTGAHEGAHAAQMYRQKRLPELVTKGEIVLDPQTKQMLLDPQGKVQFGSYIHPEPTTAEISAHIQLPENQVRIKSVSSPAEQQGITDQIVQDFKLQRFREYEAQPVEVMARRWGDVAGRAFDRFRELIEPPLMQKPLDVNQLLTRENFQEIYQDALFKRYQRELDEARNSFTLQNPDLMKSLIKSANLRLKNSLERASHFLSPTGMYNQVNMQVTPRELGISPQDIADVARRLDYTSVINDLAVPGQQAIPIQTIEDLLDIPNEQRFLNPIPRVWREPISKKGYQKMGVPPPLTLKPPKKK